MRSGSEPPLSAILYKKWFILLGLLFILAAVWLYPANPKDGWSDQKWEHHIAGSEWLFSRNDGTVLAKKLVLSSFGEIRGYDNPNERRWEVKDHALNLLGEDGRVTSRFPLVVSGTTVGLHLIQPPELGQHELKQRSDKKKTLLVLFFAIGFALLVVPFWRTSAFATKFCLNFAPSFTEERGKVVAGVLLIIWLFAACTLASMPTYVPDEAWFLVEAIASGQRAFIDHDWVVQLVFHHNAFGYGGIWWSIYTAMTLALNGLLDFLRAPETLAFISENPGFVKGRFWEYATPSLVAPMVMMRFLALLSLAVFGVLLVRYARTATAAMLCTVTLITLPIAWWSGKLASPELISAAIFAAGVLCWFVLHRPTPTLLLASLAVAIKLTVIPVYLVLLAFVFWDLWRAPNRSIPRLALYVMLCLLVILLGNLWILNSLEAGIEQLLNLSRTFKPHPDWHVQSDLLLFLHPESWEGTNYGSLTYWSGGLVLIAASLIVAMVIDRRLGLFLLLGGGGQYLFMLTQPPHPWYWFPVILAALVPFSKLRSGAAAALAVVLFFCLWPFEFTQREFLYRNLHLKELQELARQKGCIAKTLSQYQPDIVFDMVSIGTLSLQSQESKWTLKDYHDSYVSIATGLPNVASGEKRILILGEKSWSVHDFLRAASNRPDSLLGKCGSIQFVKI